MTIIASSDLPAGSDLDIEFCTLALSIIYNHPAKAVNAILEAYDWRSGTKLACLALEELLDYFLVRNHLGKPDAGMQDVLDWLVEDFDLVLTELDYTVTFGDNKGFEISVLESE